jgi:hypothetical protein
LTRKARDLHSDMSLVDFTWRRAADPHGLEGTERGGEVSSVQCLSIPIDFELVGEQVCVCVYVCMRERECVSVCVYVCV